MLVAVCEQVAGREAEIRKYFRGWRTKVGEDGVIVLGHPHPSWLGYQINPSNIFYHWNDFPESSPLPWTICRASLFVMSVALEEGIDFMSDSSYGLEMTSPALFKTMDMPYIQKFARWTHERGGSSGTTTAGSRGSSSRRGVQQARADLSRRSPLPRGGRRPCRIAQSDRQADMLQRESEPPAAEGRDPRGDRLKGPRDRRGGPGTCARIFHRRRRPAGHPPGEFHRVRRFGSRSRTRMSLIPHTTEQP